MLRSALTAVSDAPLRSGWVDVMAGVSQVGGVQTLAEVGFRLTESTSLVGTGGWSNVQGWNGSLGARWTF